MILLPGVYFHVKLAFTLKVFHRLSFSLKDRLDDKTIHFSYFVMLLKNETVVCNVL